MGARISGVTKALAENSATSTDGGSPAQNKANRRSVEKE